MANATEQLITSAILRKTIRAKLRTGVKRESVSLLIAQYGPSGFRPSRWHGMVPRVPVELIPHRNRTEFLAALANIPNGRVAAKRSLASWTMRGIAGADETQKSRGQDQSRSYGPNFPERNDNSV